MKKVALALLACILLSCSSQIQEKEKLKAEIWSQIGQHFAPPVEFQNEYGDYRSPLLFYNGDSVRSQEDWQRRRKEILDTWQEKMGKWPEILVDNQLEILDTADSLDYKIHRVKFKWTPNEYTDGYLLVPNIKGKKPAVITVFYEPETAIGMTEKPHRDFARQQAKEGYVTLSIGTREASKNQTFSLFYPSIEDAKVEPLSMLGYAAANAWEVLAKLDEVDSSRIGIVGHSFGGKWAMFGSCMYDKFACAAWSDPGIVFDESRNSVNYWEPYYLGYHPKPWRKRALITPDNPAKGVYIQLREEGFDLHELHALMAPRPFLVSGGSEDPVERWIPLNHTIKVNKLLGYENRVAMTNRPLHSCNAESNEQIRLFFDYFLK